MDLCSVCQKQVYPAERCQYESKVYHKSCFKCTQCKTTLNLSNARSFDKMPYCRHHSPHTVNQQHRPAGLGPLVQPDVSTTTTAENPEHKTAQSTQLESPARTNTLACGFDVFQSQVEVAGQVFTVDPMVQQNIFNMFKEFNIIVCGSPRVGKSTLINSICGQTLAQTHPGLDSCTKGISRYVLHETLRVGNEPITYTYNFWDTPGFESWNETDIRTNFKKIMEKPKSDPICMIFCASPSAFADTEQLKWLLDVCIHEHNLLCALVVTNKWAGQKQQRVAVLNKFQELLNSYHQQTSEENGITYFGNVALCTMINSESYIDEDLNKNYEEEGINELIEGIMTCLDDDGKVFHWCMTVINRKGIMDNYNFKGRMKQRYQDMKNFFTKRFGRNES